MRRSVPLRAAATALAVLYTTSCSPEPEPVDAAASLIEDAPLQGRYGHSVVWTGHEMIVWGGQAGTDFDDGAAYTPETDTWRAIARPEGFRGRHGHTAVWTGEEMIVSQGRAGGGGLVDGAAYDPRTDRWRPVSDAPASTGSLTAFMAGDHMVTVARETVLVHDVAADSWAREEVDFTVVDGAPTPEGEVALVGVDPEGEARAALFSPVDGSTRGLSTAGIGPGPWSNLAVAPDPDGALWVLLANTESKEFAEALTARLYRRDPGPEGEWTLVRTDPHGFLVPASGTGVRGGLPAFTVWDGDRLLSVRDAAVGVHPGSGDDLVSLRVPTDLGPCLSSRYTVRAGDELLAWSGPTCASDEPVTHPPTGLRVALTP